MAADEGTVGAEPLDVSQERRGHGEEKDGSESDPARRRNELS